MSEHFVEKKEERMKEKHDDDEYIIFVSLTPESFISCLAFQDAIYIHIKLSTSFLIRVLR